MKESSNQALKKFLEKYIDRIGFQGCLEESLDEFLLKLF